MVGHREQRWPCSLGLVRQRPAIASQGQSEETVAGVAQPWAQCPALEEDRKGRGPGEVLFGVCPSPPLKTRGSKLYVESEGEVAKRGIHSANSTALGLAREPGGSESQLCQLAVSPGMSCCPSLSSFQESFRIRSAQRRPSQEPL